MSDFYNEAVSAMYHHGSRIKLTPSWHDKNIICPNSKIYYVLRGEICVETDDEILIARAGDAILIPAGVKHSYHLTELGFAEKYWFHFDLRNGQSNFFEWVKSPHLKHLGINEHICGIFESIVNTNRSTPTGKLSVLSGILSLISLYVKDSVYIENLQRDEDETDKVITYVNKNYSENHTLEGLAEIANLTPNYFAKKFKEKTGNPPLKYINILRIERAKFLLQHSKKNISAVMEEVGFWDSAHFSKLFKSQTGYSPSKFRKAFIASTYK